MNMNFKNKLNLNKKGLIIGGSIFLACGLLTFGTFAFLSHKVQQEVTATAGGVSIKIPTISLANASNLNPGDHDITNTSTVRKGTDHTFTFTVENTGNKSIVTRNVLDIEYPYTYKVENNQAVVTSVFKKDDAFFIYNDKKEELKEKYYLVIDKYGDIHPKKTLNAYDEKAIVGVRYVLTGTSLNGVGHAAEIEAELSKTKDTYNYKLGLKKTVSNKNTQKQSIKVNLMVEAMQYRNTADSDWHIMFSETIPVETK